MPIAFEVTEDHLKNLGSERSVNLIRKLVWSDATASGIGLNLVNIPTAITVADGGIDGEITDTQFQSKNGVIKAGNTRYQIKSGDFSLNESNIKEILFKTDLTNLKERIKSCLDKDGTLVIVFTGWDNPETKDDEVKNKFIEILQKIDSKYVKAKIEIWRQNTIIGLLQNFPSLRLDILQIVNGSFYFHEEWSRLDDMKPKLHSGTEHIKYIQDFRDELRKSDQPIHIRVIGEPGIGKTKIVQEVTRTDDLANLTIYVEDPTKLENFDFINQIGRIDNTSFIILVVDECDFREQTHIWNKLKNKSPNIKLITIFNEPDSSSGTTVYLNPPELKDEQIGEILKEYGVPDDQLGKWVEFCKPSPRAAHVIGQNLKENPDDILKSPDIVPVWDRYIAGRMQLDSDEFKKRQTILRWISLFKRFGFEPPFEEESRIIWKKIDENHRISYGDFVDIVRKLRNMKILQGHNTLYITPKILHIKLWTDWWENYGPSMMFKLEELVTKDSNTGQPTFHSLNLVQWYCDMFRYAKESPRASEVVKGLLAPGGLLEKDNLLTTRLGGDFFLTLSKAEPSSALNFLNRFIGTKSKEDLLRFEEGRRQAIWALERISMKKEFFADAARLLLALGETENESYSNNASGVFISLFSPGPGKVAPTETPPSRRLPIMEEALKSNSKERRKLAIKACDAALESRYFTRSVIEYDELRDNIELWTPKSHEEVVNYYKSVLDLLMSSLEILEVDEKKEAVSIILNNVRQLITIPETSEIVLHILRNLHVKYKVDNELIIEKIIDILDFERKSLSTDLSDKLRKLQDEVTGSDFHSLMKRYVGMDSKIDWHTGTKSFDEIRKKEIEDLAKQSLNVDLLKSELKWLVTTNAKNGYKFGYELGKLDKNFQLLPTILEEQKNAANNTSGFFLGGYFLAIFEKDVKKWESEMDSMASDSKLYKFVPEVTWRSGLTDVGGKRILTLLEKTDLDFTVFNYFKYASVANRLSEKTFIEWMEFLINEKNNRAIFIALDLFHNYFVHREPKSLPKELTLRILLHVNIVNKPPHVTYDPMDEYHWKETGLQFVGQYPDDSLMIAEKMLENFGVETFFGRYNSEATEVLNEITRLKPAEVWRIASRYLGPPIDSRAFAIKGWLRGSIITYVPLGEIFSWVDENIEKRSAYLAGFIPPEFTYAREILVRYGERDDVRKSLIANFSTEGWSGHASKHYEEKKEKFIKLRNDEKDLKVKSWLDFYISIIENDIKQSLAYEEREDFG